MIETKQITSKEDFLFLIPFLQEVVAAMPVGGHSFKSIFKILYRNIETDDLAVWIQVKDAMPITFASATINHTLAGENICFLWLVYSKGRGDLKSAFFDQVVPWALLRGATKIQATDCTYKTNRHFVKNRWYKRFGLKKSFEVYERGLILC